MAIRFANNAAAIANAVDRPPMDIRRAVEILNERKHRGSTGWHVAEGDFAPDGGPLADSGVMYEWLTEMEAIAVAEKYAAAR